MIHAVVSIDIRRIGAPPNLGGRPAQAQAWPSRVVRIIVPFTRRTDRHHRPRGRRPAGEGPGANRW